MSRTSCAMRPLQLAPPVAFMAIGAKSEGNVGDGVPQHLDGDLPANAAGPTEDQVGDYTLVPGQEADEDLGFYLDFSDNPNPQAIRGGNGATDSGPHNIAYQQQNSDLYARPGTDSGDIPNAKWPMDLSSSHSGTGGDNPGWARQQNVEVMPVATEMAGVDMRLGPNAYCEMHWHSANEWSYIFSGGVRVSAMNQNGETFVDDLRAGDLWYFPTGVPHSIQATDEGVEFLLVFSQGDFSEDATELATEMMLRNPLEVLEKNFEADVSAFRNLPDDQKYIFTGTRDDQTLEQARAAVQGCAGEVPANQSYSFHLSAQEPLTVPGGSAKIVDPTTFTIANNYTVGLFSIEPGAMREIHWHLTSDEWNLFLQGQGRVTVDVGYVTTASPHYVENTGNETLVYMEVLQALRYADVSAAQWLALTPAQVVKETLNVDQAFIDKLPKTKRYVVPGNEDLTTTNFTVSDYPNARNVSGGGNGEPVGNMTKRSFRGRERHEGHVIHTTRIEEHDKCAG